MHAALPCCPAIRERSEDFLTYTSMPNVDTPEEHLKDDLELPLLDLGTVIAATNNLFDDNKLGEGGFGPVYKVSSFIELQTSYISW